MSDLIDRNELIDYFCQKDCDFDQKVCALFPCHEIKIIKNAPSVQPTHETPSNTLGALDCVERQAAIDLVESFYKIDKSVLKIMVFKLKQLPSVQPEFSNNSKELENKNGELISRQKAKDAIDMALDHIDHVPSWVYDNLLNVLNEVPSVQPEEVIPHRNYKYLSDFWCECGNHLGKKGDVKYCSDCGKKVKWDE